MGRCGREAEHSGYCTQGLGPNLLQTSLLSAFPPASSISSLQGPTSRHIALPYWYLRYQGILMFPKVLIKKKWQRKILTDSTTRKGTFFTEWKINISLEWKKLDVLNRTENVQCVRAFFKSKRQLQKSPWISEQSVFSRKHWVKRSLLYKSKNWEIYFIPTKLQKHLLKSYYFTLTKLWVHRMLKCYC